MDPKDVVRIAEKYLTWAKEEKKVQYEYYMSYSRTKLTKDMNAWWRLWWKRNPTEQEVYDDFSGVGDRFCMFSMKSRVDLLFSKGEEIAKKLIKACSVAKDEVYVSVEDVSEIT
jgi:hypothetical protein